jgi:hypothetical protein
VERKQCGRAHGAWSEPRWVLRGIAQIGIYVAVWQCRSPTHWRPTLRVCIAPLCSSITTRDMAAVETMEATREAFGAASELASALGSAAEVGADAVPQPPSADAPPGAAAARDDDEDEVRDSGRARMLGGRHCARVHPSRGQRIVRNRAARSAAPLQASDDASACSSGSQHCCACKVKDDAEGATDAEGTDDAEGTADGDATGGCEGACDGRADAGADEKWRWRLNGRFIVVVDCDVCTRTIPVEEPFFMCAACKGNGYVLCGACLVGDVARRGATLEVVPHAAASALLQPPHGAAATARLDVY